MSEPTCEHEGCRCERCQGDWCGDVGNVVYAEKRNSAVPENTSIRRSDRQEPG